jgi:Skp family chaperone for outer membrane proteins
VSRSRAISVVIFTFACGGCAVVPPHFAVINRQEWAVAKPLTNPQDAQWLIEPFARQHGLNLVLDDDQLLYVTPDLDVTLTLLGKEAHPVHVGEHLGRVDLNAVLMRSKEAIAAKARLYAELKVKQAELDQLQLALKRAQQDTPRPDPAQTGDDPRWDAIENQRVALRRRFEELRSEMAKHENEAVLAIIDKVKHEVETLAKQHRLDGVIATTIDARQVYFRRQTPFPPRGIDLTEELIRLHDQHVP